MFPKAPHSEHDALVEISWEEFFEEFEKRKLALLYDPKSMFSKIVSRTAQRTDDAGRRRSIGIARLCDGCASPASGA